MEHLRNTLCIMTIAGILFMFAGCNQNKITVFSHDTHESYIITDHLIVDEFDSFCHALSDPINDQYSNVFWNHIESDKNILYFSYDEVHDREGDDKSIIIECNGKEYEILLDSEAGKNLKRILDDIMKSQR